MMAVGGSGAGKSHTLNDLIQHIFIYLFSLLIPNPGLVVLSLIEYVGQQIPKVLLSQRSVRDPSIAIQSYEQGIRSRASCKAEANETSSRSIVELEIIVNTVRFSIFGQYLLSVKE